MQADSTRTCQLRQLKEASSKESACPGLPYLQGLGEVAYTLHNEVCCARVQPCIVSNFLSALTPVMRVSSINILTSLTGHLQTTQALSRTGS